MPAESWRMYPARSNSLWLITSASAGVSRNVGINSLLQSIVFCGEISLLADSWGGESVPTHSAGFSALRVSFLPAMSALPECRLESPHGRLERPLHVGCACPTIQAAVSQSLIGAIFLAATVGVGLPLINSSLR